MSELVKKLKDYEAGRGGRHWAGTLTAGPLERIEYYLAKLSARKPIKSVETGCGASTIVFSIYVEQHTAL